MYKIVPTTRFKKDLKLAIKRGYNIELLKIVIDTLSTGKKLPEMNRDHSLHGEYSGFRECHISPDWLLIYEISGDDLILYLIRTGTHSDLF